jgi:hypothetical protein
VKLTSERRLREAFAAIIAAIERLPDEISAIAPKSCRDAVDGHTKQATARLVDQLHERMETALRTCRERADAAASRN